MNRYYLFILRIQKNKQESIQVKQINISLEVI